MIFLKPIQNLIIVFQLQNPDILLIKVVGNIYNNFTNTFQQLSARSFSYVFSSSATATCLLLLLELMPSIDISYMHRLFQSRVVVRCFKHVQRFYTSLSSGKIKLLFKKFSKKSFSKKSSLTQLRL